MVRIYGRVVDQTADGIKFDLAAAIDGGTAGRVLFFERGTAQRDGHKYGWDVLAVTKDAINQVRQGHTHVRYQDPREIHARAQKGQRQTE